MSAARVYVYYKVAPERLGDLRRIVEQLFTAVQRASGVRGQWQRRRDDPSTYMEIYPEVRDLPRFEILLESECERLGIERYLTAGSARRVEIFVAAD